MTSLPPSVRSARGLYLITPEEPDTARLLARVATVLPQATWLQYRQKAADAGRRLAQALAALGKCGACACLTVINLGRPARWRRAMVRGALHLGVFARLAGVREGRLY